VSGVLKLRLVNSTAGDDNLRGVPALPCPWSPAHCWLGTNGGAISVLWLISAVARAPVLAWMPFPSLGWLSWGDHLTQLKSGLHGTENAMYIALGRQLTLGHFPPSPEPLSLGMWRIFPYSYSLAGIKYTSWPQLLHPGSPFSPVSCLLDLLLRRTEEKGQGRSHFLMGYGGQNSVHF